MPLASKSKGGSAQTFGGLIAYVSQHRPLMILFENVDAMEDSKGGSSNMNVFMSQMAAQGYEGRAVVADSCEWGLPARRRRVRVLGACGCYPAAVLCRPQWTLYESLSEVS